MPSDNLRLADTASDLCGPPENYQHDRARLVYKDFFVLPRARRARCGPKPVPSFGDYFFSGRAESLSALASASQKPPEHSPAELPSSRTINLYKDMTQ